MEADPLFMAKASAREVLRRIKKDILNRHVRGFSQPLLGDVPYENLRKRDAQAVVDAVRARGDRVANLLASDFVRLGKYAQRRDLVDEDLPNRLRDFERTRQHARQRALGVMDTTGEIAEWELARFVQRLPHMDIHPGTVLALLLLLATGQRPGEVAGTPKAELTSDGSTWAIDPKRLKTSWRETNPRPHLVPLSSYARQLLALAGVLNHRSVWVFPSPGDVEQHLTAHSLPRALNRKLGTPTPADQAPAAGTFGLQPFTAHDLRRTCRTWLAVLGVPDHVAEAVLGHKAPGIVRIYNVHGYLDERRAALELWGDKLQALGPDVLPELARQLAGHRRGRTKRAFDAAAAAAAMAVDAADEG